LAFRAEPDVGVTDTVAEHDRAAGADAVGVGRVVARNVMVSTPDTSDTGSDSERRAAKTGKTAGKHGRRLLKTGPFRE
jgi:hypothetical protein